MASFDLWLGVVFIPVVAVVVASGGGLVLVFGFDWLARLARG